MNTVFAAVVLLQALCATPARVLRDLELNPQSYNRTSGQPSDVLLGDLLFHTPAVLGMEATRRAISCNTCHVNGAANPCFEPLRLGNPSGSVDLTDGLFRPEADSGIVDPVNIPSLRGARYCAPYGHDGRVESLSEFINGVIVSEFGGSPLDAEAMRALVAYVQALDLVPNRNLDSFGRLRTGAPESARRGEALFKRPFPQLADQSCSTCHPPGTYFTDGRIHRRPVAKRAGPNSWDDGIATPTLLGVSETPPYFHTGVAATLPAVVEWYDSAFALGLSPSELAELSEYLAAVGAVDRVTDDRTVGQRLRECNAYVELLKRPRLALDPVMRGWIVDAILGEFERSLAPDEWPTAAKQAAHALDSLRRSPDREPLTLESLDRLRVDLELAAVAIAARAASTSDAR